MGTAAGSPGLRGGDLLWEERKRELGEGPLLLGAAGLICAL